MTTSYPQRWYPENRQPVAVEHPGLVEREAAEDALRGNWASCSCYDVASMEYGPVPCDVCRAEALNEIDVDGYDDKRETPAAS